jgi:methionyl-tRNA synthetase
LSNKNQQNGGNNKMNRNILVAAAWPYANGSLHLGHVAALIGSDILARYFRLNGDSVLFVSGSDCHGTPIALEADRQGIHPSVIADRYHDEFTKTLIDGLAFSYDVYSKTTTENHCKVVQEIFLKLYHDGHIYTKTEELPFCGNCRRFLPDRYIEGECPACHFSSARGDQCDGCGGLVDVKQLIDPRCKICGSSPEWKKTEHFFLKLTAFQDKLKKWVEESTGWRANAKNFTTELLNQGLIDRAITRDTEWGIPIPLEGFESKKIYVWFEAVCGYLSASKEWSVSIGKDDEWKKYWANPKAVHYYVHGKDNIPFHTVIWPSILFANGGLHLPDRILSSEYLTLDKKQFSKSRHWAVWLPDFLSEFDPEALRYYLVINGSETSDADFSWKEFLTRTNSELIGNFGNYIHRILSFIQKNFPDGVRFPEAPDEKAVEFLNLAEEAFSLTALSIEAGRFREGLRQVIKLVEHGNRYINDVAPWSTIKNDRKKTESDLAVASHVIKCLAILINPFLPKSSELICTEIGVNFLELKWAYPAPGLLKVNNPMPLYKRIEEETVSRQCSLQGKK